MEQNHENGVENNGLDKGNTKGTANNEVPGELSEKESEERFLIWYNDVCEERMRLLEAEDDYKKQIHELETTEKGYKRRIKDLENSSSVLLKAFEEVQLEVKNLRNKYEPKDDNLVYAESYGAVAKERDTLKENERRNKMRIETLEEEVLTLRNYVKDFNLTSSGKKDRGPTKNVDRLVVITNSERLETLEEENGTLKYKMERMARAMKTFERQVTSNQKLPVNKKEPYKKNKEKLVINKKNVPTFLPRILPSASSGFVSDECRTKTVSSLHRSTQTSSSSLMFGLSYGDIHQRRNNHKSHSSESGSLSPVHYDSITKYLA